MVGTMDQRAIVQYISDTYAGVDVESPDDGPGAGDTFFIYDPERNLPGNKQMPFATIVTKDYGDFDNLSKLDRDGVYRLNIGVSRETFRTLFPTDTEQHFAAFDTRIPYSVYAPQSTYSKIARATRFFAISRKSSMEVTTGIAAHFTM